MKKREQILILCICVIVSSVIGFVIGRSKDKDCKSECVCTLKNRTTVPEVFIMPCDGSANKWNINAYRGIAEKIIPKDVYFSITIWQKYTHSTSGLFDENGQSVSFYCDKGSTEPSSLTEFARILKIWYGDKGVK